MWYFGSLSLNNDLNGGGSQVKQDSQALADQNKTKKEQEKGPTLFFESNLKMS